MALRKTLPVFPIELLGAVSMSALGQKQTLTLRSDDARFTSKADIETTQTDVRFVPIADMAGIKLLVDLGRGVLSRQSAHVDRRL